MASSLFDGQSEVEYLLQTELKILSFLLKDRVSPGNLWEIVGERTIEAKQEGILRQHQSNYFAEFQGQRHVIVEHILMEERKKRSQMEVSLYRQAIEHVQQHRMFHRFACPVKRDIRSPSTCSACPTVTREKCEAWLGGRYAHPLSDAPPLMGHYCFLHASTHSTSGFIPAHNDKWTSVILNCVGASLSLLSTCVAVDVQEAFYDAFHAEQACQAGLMTQSFTVNGDLYHRDIGLELLILQAKMRCAQAEIDLYMVATKNAREFDSCDNISVSSSSGGSNPPPLPRPDKLYYYDIDRDDVTDDFDNFQFE
ncbi:uncharacterized protein EDB91DRAFT_1076845 [Suillus paluster]|uniref:uncharacterized protein n=1 Tax=Suillus paluster TaxID=48578 RepID=UPI001B885507|nr:uncharacterized protein EDB91DRAFT_1076845 [Suillus paluster]KAG1754739.1 hypothetical protein EDB91DRAFT_1076845 [Suillus paluster]